MATPGGVKISLDSVGLTLSSAMPNFANVANETNDLCSLESSQRSFIFVSKDESEESLSIVVLDKSSLDAIQSKSVAVYEQLRHKSMSLDYKSMLPSMTQLQVKEKLTELLRENSELKETLAKNNMAMKQHLVNLVREQEKLSKVHESHKQKFTAIKTLVNQLRTENSELKAQIEDFDKKLKEREAKMEKQTEIRSLEMKKDEESLEKERNEETMKLALKCEEQTQEIAKMQTTIATLNEQINLYCRNTLTSIKSNDSLLCKSNDFATLQPLDGLSLGNYILVSNLDYSLESQQTKTEAKKEEKLLDNKTVEAAKCEGHAKEIAELRMAAESLDKKIYSSSRNKIDLIETSFDAMKLNDYSSLPKTEDPSSQEYYTNLTSYKNMLKSLDKSYESQAARHIRIQEYLQRCNEILLENRNSKENSSENHEEKCRELQNCRDGLIDEELGTIIDRQEMIKSQSVYQQIFRDYSSSISRLIELKTENERLKSLKIGDKIYEKRLETERTRLEEIKRLIEEEQRSLMTANRELSEKRLELEKEYLRIQENENKLVETNASLNEDMILLQEHLKVYESDFQEEIQLRNKMIAEKTTLFDQMKQMEEERNIYFERWQSSRGNN